MSAHIHTSNRQTGSISGNTTGSVTGSNPCAKPCSKAPLVDGLRDAFDSLPAADAIKAIEARLAKPLNPHLPAPTIKAGTDHFLYALLVTNGLNHPEACAELGVRPRTAEGWKGDLLKTARAYYGRDVEYDYVARLIIETTIAKLNKRTPPGNQSLQ